MALPTWHTPAAGPPDSVRLPSQLRQAYPGPERRRWGRDRQRGDLLGSAIAYELDHAIRLAASITASRAAAAAILVEAEHLVRQSRGRRLQRVERMAILRTLADRPNPMLLMCAWCARARTWTGAWVLMPAGLEDELLSRDKPLITHGVCPDCAQRLNGTRDARL